MASRLQAPEVPEGFLNEGPMLSPFGRMLTELCEEKKVTRTRLAEAVGVAPSYITVICRDPEVARRKGKRFQGPKIEYLNRWARELGLDEEQSALFHKLGVEAKMRADPQRAPHLERYLEVREELLSHRVDALEGLVNRLSAVCSQFMRQLHEHGITPSQSASQDLQAAIKEINAADEDL